MDTRDELNQRAYAEAYAAESRRRGEPETAEPEALIDVDDIMAAASELHRMAQAASRRDHAGLSVDQRVSLYEAADKARGDLYNLIEAFGEQQKSEGFARGYSKALRGE